METEYAGQKVNLLHCPYCGSDPIIHRYKRNVIYYRIRCANDREICRMLPETTAYRKLEQAAADWNMRATD